LKKEQHCGGIFVLLGRVFDIYIVVFKSDTLCGC